MTGISPTLDTSHFERSLLKDGARMNIKVMLVVLDTFQFERSPLNNVALMNMRDMLVTLETSHLDRLLLNEFALENTPLMSVTLDTSQSPSCPLGPLAQPPFGESLRHASTALLSPALNSGENAATGKGRTELEGL